MSQGRVIFWALAASLFGFGFLGRGGRGDAFGAARRTSSPWRWTPDARSVLPLGSPEAPSDKSVRPALEGQAVQFDQVGAIGGRREIDDSSGAIDHEIAALGIGDDDHGTSLESIPAATAIHGDPFALCGGERSNNRPSVSSSPRCKLH